MLVLLIIKLKKWKKNLILLGGLFDLDSIEKEISALEEEMAKDNFWDNIDYANNINQKLTNLKKSISSYNKLNDSLSLIKEVLDTNDEELINESILELDDLSKDIEDLELTTLLNGKYDSLNCFLEIHPGAGGTESCDFASMLYRMYTRFLEKNNYTYEVINLEDGEEAGIKSVTILIKGFYPYGYLKGETGVHRLVRISPFDSNARRHTSFASVMVTPEFNNDINIDIKDSDLKIDVYHSSGAGGQSVNTSNSAVRITHLPSKIVVTCQVERSQARNKDMAMQMLKSKLYQQEILKQQEQLSSVKGETMEINFGSQIRNYVLEPYKLIKDLRSGYETSNTDKVLDGEIMPIIKSVLKNK
ncbi:MAG: peptide chain release factor 2 [Bacilli bacterium]|nr:peptide chain release factor 2 [Bacilli bacterium]